MFKKSLLFISASVLILVTGCSHFADLNAPCSYTHRADCGPVVPLQQGH